MRSSQGRTLGCALDPIFFAISCRERLAKPPVKVGASRRHLSTFGK